MAPPTVFAIPSTSRKQWQSDPRWARQRKRTRQGVDKSASSVGEGDANRRSWSPLSQVPEYTAVITPEERSQRRLAGLSLDRDLPSEPFPHAALQIGENGISRSLPTSERRRSLQTPLSLRDQHLAAMLAVLHRSLMCHDYTRARRALGLILHCEEGGQPLDIRGEGLWGVGAEILLHIAQQGAERSTLPQPVPERVTREGFEQAKTYYDRLVVQYPPNSGWKSAVNAIDFLVAMLGLWIYTVHQESLQMPTIDVDCGGEDDLGDRASPHDKTVWELTQAIQIADAMDSRMNNVTYREEPELMRLRAMVASWVADLTEDRLELEEKEQLDRRFEDDMDAPSANVERVYTPLGQPRDHDGLRAQVIQSRALAQSLFDKLRRIH